MAIKIYRPTTPGRRKTSIIDDKSLIGGYKPHKALLLIKRKKGGRNMYGRITVRHQGGGEKRYYRLLDFKQNKFDIPAKVASIEYDPNRTARIALISYQDGQKSYILCPKGLNVGDTIMSSQKRTEVKVGYRMPLSCIPVGEIIFNIELVPGKGGEVVRSAGSSAQLMALEGDYAQVKMPSSEIRLISKDCLATIGQVGNLDHFNVRLGKAGRSRHMGIRPSVRGKVMNPNDHPHGGGEGKCPIGLKYPKTPWGKHALGVKTRKPKNKANKFILKKRVKKN